MRFGVGTMRIGEFCERAGLSQRTVRHYDEIGLLVPSHRTEGGFREYTDGDLDRLLLIRRMKPLDYTLEQMGEVLAAVDAGSPAVLDAFLADAEARRTRLAERVTMAEEFLDRLRSARSELSS